MRLFSGPLSRRSAQYALTVLGSLFDWLVAPRYLLANPIAALPLQTVPTAAAQTDPDRLSLDADGYFTRAQGASGRSKLHLSRHSLGRYSYRKQVGMILPYRRGR